MRRGTRDPQVRERREQQEQGSDAPRDGPHPRDDPHKCRLGRREEGLWDTLVGGGGGKKQEEFMRTEYIGNYFSHCPVLEDQIPLSPSIAARQHFTSQEAGGKAL